MTLTVRLDSAIESALERYCAERGVTKSLVVQECLAGYLLADQAQAGKAALAERAAAAEPQVSDNYKAFAEAGLIGGIALGHGADKAAVRARIAESFAQRKARRGGV
ncbi:MAG: hypothetical protein H7337_13070 [Rhizobacter sp.]|nr:hypothetical protein [Rhizobacter sp.]